VGCPLVQLDAGPGIHQRVYYVGCGNHLHLPHPLVIREMVEPLTGASHIYLAPFIEQYPLPVLVCIPDYCTGPEFLIFNT
jgi:hypothetical protein